MTSSTVYSAGDVVVVPFPFDDGSGEKRRPALVVSTEAFNRRLDRVILVPITTTRVPATTYLAVELERGSLPAQCNVLPDHVNTLSQRLIAAKVGRVAQPLLAKVLRVVHSNMAT